MEETLSPTIALLERIKDLQKWQEQNMSVNEGHLDHFLPDPDLDDYPEAHWDQVIQDVLQAETNPMNFSIEHNDGESNSLILSAPSQNDNEEATNIIDELPIKGIPKSKKFNDFVEEKLQSESPSIFSSSKSTKKPFLKRGEGLGTIKKYGRLRLRSKKAVKSNCTQNPATRILPLKTLQLSEDNLDKRSAKPQKHLVETQDSYRSSVDLSEPSESFVQEKDELSAFEHLEELADNTSFSSNSSTVVKLLNRGSKNNSSVNPEEKRKGRQTCLLSKLQESEKTALESPVIENNFKNVIDHIKEFIKLDGTDTSVTEEEIYAALQLLTEDNTLPPAESLPQFFENLRNEYTSTPNDEQKNPVARSVPIPTESSRQFKSLGNEYNTIPDERLKTPVPVNDAPQRVRFTEAQVLEFEVSESEDTLTDAPSLGEESVSVNDLQTVMLPRDNTNQFHSNVSETLLHVEDDNEPLLLQYSPPKVPPDSGSYYIWSNFSKGRNIASMKRQHPISKPPVVNKKIITNNESEIKSKEEIDVDAHKILLNAKMNELEEEIKKFHENNAFLEHQRKTLFDDKQKLEIEKENFLKFKADETLKLQNIVLEERKSSWKKNKTTGLSTIEIEIIRKENSELKDIISDLKEQLVKKDTANQFTLKKVKDKVRSLEVTNRNQKERINYLQNLEKENLNLKHQLDRSKLSLKTKSVLGLKKGENISSKYKKSQEKSNVATQELPETPNISIVDIYANKHSSFPRNQGKNLDLLTSPEYTKRLEGLNKYQPTENIVISNTPLSMKSYLDDNLTPSVKDSTDLACNPNPHAGNNPSVPQQKNLNDFTERIRPDGSKEILYSNGNRKEYISDNNYVMYFYNGDVKQVYHDKTTYIYASDDTSHTTFNDGRQILEFSNGQRETHFPDGSSEIRLPDESTKHISAEGNETIIFQDGTTSSTSLDGSKIIEYPNGQKEIHKNNGIKERVYPDGTVKSVHLDGTMETRYKNGRIRKKDVSGNILYDGF